MEKGDADVKDMPQASAALTAYAEVVDNLMRWQSKIEEALGYEPGLHTFDDVCIMVMRGQLQLYSFPKSFALMEVKVYSQAKAYHCFIAGGELAEVIASQDKIIGMAKLYGCSLVTLAGRKGWERAFRDTDWKPLCTVLYKHIDADPILHEIGVLGDENGKG